MIHLVSIRDQFAKYVRAHPLKTPTEKRMDLSIRVFSAWLQRDAVLSDLADDTVNEWLRSLEKTYAAKSIKGFRGDLLALWRWLAASPQRLCDPPTEIRKIKLGEPCPISWTDEEAAKIVSRCRELTGVLPNGISRAIYCECLFRFGYDSGLRRSDCWTIRRNQIRADGTIVLRQHKTGHAHWPVIRPETLALLAQLPGDSPLACPWKKTSRWYTFWKTHVTGPAGVRHGSMQQVRRTGATHLAIEHPEAVQRYLGHRSPEMQRFYIDYSIAKPQRHLPPDILPPPPLGTT